MRRWLWWFLRKPIQSSGNLENVEKSWSQWGGYNEDDPVCVVYSHLYGTDDNPRYTLSILGWINGWLPKIMGRVLSLTKDEPLGGLAFDQKNWKFQLRKKWW